MQEIEILVGTDGAVTVEGKGIAGADCVKLTEGLEKALGDVQRRELKPEYRLQRTAGRTVGR